MNTRDPGDRATHRHDIAEVTARFAGLLHAAGLQVTPERAGRLAAGMALCAPGTYSELYWMARVTLVSDRGGIEVFDRVFAQVFGGLADPADQRGQERRPPRDAKSRTRSSEPGPGGRPRGATGPSAVLPDADDQSGDEARSTDPAVLTAMSADERLRSKNFSALTPEELARIRVLAARMAFVTPPRHSRRHVRHPLGPDLDVRATLRRSRRSGGEPLVAVRRRRRVRPRRLVLLCDVSGSMEPYSRAYLHLLVSGVNGARAEAFVFATRLTRLTRALRGALPDLAIERAGAAAPDWSGGTRIGEAVKAFNDSYGRPGLARGSLVVILSDGWESGDPGLLAEEMARLRRLAHRVVWVNPRKAAPGYQPLTQGMAAALPHVDAFVSGHSLEAVEEVLEAIAGPAKRKAPSERSAVIPSRRTAPG